MAGDRTNHGDTETPSASITKAAKALVLNPNASSVYIQAVSSTVSAVITAIEAKVQREAAERAVPSEPSPPAESDE